MAGPFVENGWHVRQRYLLSGQIVENEFYYVSTATPDQTVMDELATVQNDWATDNWHNLLPTNCSVTGCIVECLDPDFLVTQPYQLPSPVAGAGAAGEPNNVSFSIQRVIIGRYRGGHPRLYIPGIRSDKVSSINSFDTTHANLMVTELESLRSLMLASTSEFKMVALRTTGTGATPTEPAAKLVLGHRIVDYTLDSQRRRMPGRGR